MKSSDRLKINLTRNWKLPGRQKLLDWLHPSEDFKNRLSNGIAFIVDEDLVLYTTADNYIESMILRTGTYETEVNKLMKISLKPGDVAIDVGGNIGLQSIRMSRCVGDTGKVYAFEPLNYLQDKFLKNISLNRADNVTLFPYALSDSDSEADFTINSHAWNQGTFSINGKTAGNEVQHVHIKVADELPEIKALDRLTLVKIDVEGFEYPVFRGMQKVLKKFKPRIIFEYDSGLWDIAGQKISDCYNFLLGLDYDIFLITAMGGELISDPARMVTGNMFCVPR